METKNFGNLKAEEGQLEKKRLKMGRARKCRGEVGGDQSTTPYVHGDITVNPINFDY